MVLGENKVVIKTDSVSLALEVTFILVLQALAVINQTRWYISSFLYRLLAFWLKDDFSDLPRQKALATQILDSFSVTGYTNRKTVAQLYAIIVTIKGTGN